ncbi:MAG TPA: hypothetical protein VG308_01270 [Stellaceae bacterium]|nr:hypothetical protein [Stellaceae bacterium]
MSHTQVQWARGSTPQIGAYTGPIGELVLNTDDWSLQAQDGVTAGGWVMRPRLSVRTVTGTGAQSVGVTDDLIAWAPATPAATTFTLPASPRVGEAHAFKYLAASGNFSLTVAAPAGQTIDGLAAVAINTLYATVSVAYAGGNVWIVAGALPQSFALPGQGTAIAASLSAAGMSVTITGDAFAVATALNGASFVLPSFSHSFNGATTGAGGMDTGSLPVSGFVAIYAIYNPATQAAALLGTNGGTSCPTIYAGGHMPSGYTASGLIAVWPTNGSAQLVAAYLTGRKLTFAPVNAVNTASNNASPQSQSIAPFVPPNATSVGGLLINIMGTSPTAGNYQIEALSDVGAAIGRRQFVMPFPATSGALGVTPFEGLPVPTPQTLYYVNSASGTSPSSIISLTSYAW